MSKCPGKSPKKSGAASKSSGHRSQNATRHVPKPKQKPEKESSKTRRARLQKVYEANRMRKHAKNKIKVIRPRILMMENGEILMPDTRLNAKIEKVLVGGASVVKEEVPVKKERIAMSHAAAQTEPWVQGLASSCCSSSYDTADM